MPANNGYLGLGYPLSATPNPSVDANRLSYPMLMAILGASQGAGQQGNDWVDLGSGFKAYDNSPKRALMGLVSGGAQGYMAGKLQERQQQGMAQADAVKRALDADKFKTELGLKTEAEIKKQDNQSANAFENMSLMEVLKHAEKTSPAAALAQANKMGYKTTEEFYAAVQSKRNQSINKDEFDRRMKEEALKWQQEQDRAKIGNDYSRLQLAIGKDVDRELSQPLKDDLLRAQAEKLRQPAKPSKVTMAEIILRAVAETMQMFPNWNPMFSPGDPAMTEANNWNTSRRLQLLKMAGGNVAPDEPPAETAVPAKKPLASYF